MPLPAQATLAAKVHELDEAIQKTEAQLAELIADHARKIERLDLLRFQREEIQKANPKTGETEAAHQQLAVLSHATKLLDAATRGYEHSTSPTIPSAPFFHKPNVR